MQLRSVRCSAFWPQDIIAGNALLSMSSTVMEKPTSWYQACRGGGLQGCVCVLGEGGEGEAEELAWPAGKVHGKGRAETTGRSSAPCPASRAALGSGQQSFLPDPSPPP
jgi:hypothetical protein